MLIDRYLPTFDVTQISETRVEASPEETYRAIREADLRDPLVQALFSIRALPLRIARRLHRAPPPPPPPAPGKVTFGSLTNAGTGWVLLAEQPGVEFVVGSVGRFWRRDYGGRPVTAEEFVPFREPGYAKLAVSLAVQPAATGGTMLRYEARTATTDAVARRTFRRYWRLIRPGVAVVMRRALRSIKLDAERRVAKPGAPGIAWLNTLNPVRATRFERARPLPGDRLISQATGSFTHAITVQCERQDLWPWIAQMGAGRAGWYSYDFIDNGREPSAVEIRPELQHIGIGSVLPGLPGLKDGFIVAQCDPPRVLVLGWPSPDGAYGSTWAFVLEDAGPGRTRLIARARGSRGYQFHGLPLWLIKAGHYVMQRKQLRGIAWRAEHRTHSAPLEVCS
jgi:hypothetical protein